MKPIRRKNQIQPTNALSDRLTAFATLDESSVLVAIVSTYLVPQSQVSKIETID